MIDHYQYMQFQYCVPNCFVLLCVHNNWFTSLQPITRLLQMATCKTINKIRVAQTEKAGPLYLWATLGGDY